MLFFFRTVSVILSFAFSNKFTVSLPISKKEKILLGSLQDFIDSLRQFRENCDLEGAEFSNPYSRNVFPIP